MKKLFLIVLVFSNLNLHYSQNSLDLIEDNSKIKNQISSNEYSVFDNMKFNELKKKNRVIDRLKSDTRDYQLQIFTSYGYGITLGRNNFNYLNYNFYNLEPGQIDYFADSNTTSNALSGKFGTGNNYSLGLGLLIDSIYRLDLEFNQFNSVNNQVGYQDIFYTSYREHNMTANVKSLSLKFGISKKWNKNSLSISIGPIIGIGQIKDFYVQREDTQKEYDFLLKDDFLIGCAASIDYKHQLPFGFELFTSCSIRNLTLSPDYIKSDFYSNGPVYFVDTKNNTNENSFLKTSYSLNAINLKLGIIYNIHL
jgi:hypothetical protein